MKSDETLIRSVVAGDVDAFGPLVERYHTGVYALIWSIVQDSGAAEDITQEAFITAYTRLSELRDVRRFPGWLRRIAANSARMWLRKRDGRAATGEVERIAGPTGAGGFRVEIARAFASLPEKQRQAAILFYLEGTSR